jgi:hypothetical protein
VLGAPARTVESGTGANGTGVGSLTGDTVKSLGSGDVGGTVKTLGDTVTETPKTVKKVTDGATKQLPKVEVKPNKGTVVPEAEVKLPGGGSVDTKSTGTSPSVTLPQTQLPSTGQLPLVGDTLSSTGLGL